MQQLFGVFAVHSPESCPLNNKTSKDVLIQIDDKLQEIATKHKISKVVGFYFSVLEHQWILILEAESAHEIEMFCIEVGISFYNTVKIVPLNEFGVVMKRIKGA